MRIGTLLGDDFEVVWIQRLTFLRRYPNIVPVTTLGELEEELEEVEE